MFKRQLFFFQQRLFAVISFLLLDNLVSSRLRIAVLRALGARVGRGSFIRGGLHLQESFTSLNIGNEVFVNNNCLFDGSASITIHDRAQMGYGVILLTGNHDVGDRNKRCGPSNPRPIVIGAGAWIGAGALIMAGVTVGEGAVVMARAVVGTNVPENTLVGGNPARQVKRFDD